MLAGERREAHVAQIAAWPEQRLPGRILEARVLPEVPRVVDDGAGIGLLAGHRQAELLQPGRDARAASARIDDEVRGQLRAVLGSQAGHARSGRGQALHPHAGLKGDSRVVLGHAAQTPLEQRPPACEPDEIGVLGRGAARHAIAERYIRSARGRERAEHIRELALEQRASEPKHEVREAEMRHPRSVPVDERGAWVGGRPVRVTLEERHRMPATGKGERRPQPRDARADHRNVHAL